jgi:hypothetical protein
MDVIRFPCLSLGSSTVQLHVSLGSRSPCTYSEAGFSSQKDSMQRIFTKKCFLFMVGSVCRVKRFTTGSRNSLKDIRKLQMISQPGRSVEIVTEATVQQVEELIRARDCSKPVQVHSKKNCSCIEGKRWCVTILLKKCAVSVVFPLFCPTPV